MSIPISAFLTPSFNPNDPEEAQRLLRRKSLFGTEADVRPGVSLPKSAGAPSFRLPESEPPASNIPSPDFMSKPEIRREDAPIPSLPGRHGQPRPYDDITAAEYDYVNSHANSANTHGFWNRLKSGLKPAALGALQGLGQGASNGAGGALGGAIVGMLGGAIDPTSARQMEFRTLQQPQIEARQARERQSQEDRMKEALRLAQIRNMEEQQADRDLDRQFKESEAQARSAGVWRGLEGAQGRRVYNDRTGESRDTGYVPEAKPLNPHWAQTEDGYVDLNASENKGKQFKAPSRQKTQSMSEALKEAEAIRMAEEGSAEQIARDSTEARSEEILRSLPQPIKTF